MTIPPNREKTVDFLCADKSALPRELARMKGEGVIDYSKNRFTLLS